MSTPRRDESSFVNWADEPSETVPPSPEQSAREFWDKWYDSKDGQDAYEKFWPDEISNIATRFAQAYADAVSSDGWAKAHEMYRELYRTKEELLEAERRISELEKELAELRMK